jgi:Collagen triple helix repeat (20 copies)
MTKRALVLTPMLFGAVVACGSGSNGAAGASSLIVTSTEPPGSNCTNGGIKIEVGEDTNGNGMLDPSEITNTSYACNGSNGANGTNGMNGANGDAGLNGTNGEAGMNGANGEAGMNGISYLTTATTVAAGTNCASGGVEIQTGPDTNRNGMLDPSEVTSTTYVCNGAPAPTNGTTPSVTAYNAGDVLASTANTSVTLESASITVPGAGSIVAIGAVDAFCSSPATGAGYDCDANGITDGYVTLATSATAGATSGDYDYFYLTPNDTESMTRTAVIPVTTAGTYTSYLLGEAADGQIGYFRPQVTLVFIAN